MVRHSFVQMRPGEAKLMNSRPQENVTLSLVMINIYHSITFCATSRLQERLNHAIIVVQGCTWHWIMTAYFRSTLHKTCTIINQTDIIMRYNTTSRSWFVYEICSMVKWIYNIHRPIGIRQGIPKFKTLKWQWVLFNHCSTFWNIQAVSLACIILVDIRVYCIILFGRGDKIPGGGTCPSPWAFSVGDSLILQCHWLNDITNSPLCIYINKLNWSFVLLPTPGRHPWGPHVMARWNIGTPS